MRKFIVIFALACVFMLGLNTSIMAQDEIININMWKDVYSHGAEYGVEFELGYDVGDVIWTFMLLPNAKIMFLKNPFGFNKLEFEAWGMSYEEFEYRFPEGKYTIILFPQLNKSLAVNLTHDFPQTPVITYPSDGATNVPLGITIEWDSLEYIDGFCLTIEGGALHNVIIDLPPDVTSFTFPSGILQPNTQYELCVESDIFDSIGNCLSSGQYIYFTTGAE